MAKNPIQSYKQISVDGPASRAAATNIQHVFAQGVDNYTGPSATNNEVPTGAKLITIDLQLAFSQLVAVSSNIVFSVQVIGPAQGVVTPNAQGGNSMRNQVIYTRNFFCGKEQNTNFHLRLKIPRVYQRVKEGTLYMLVYRADTVFASVTQAIYKFYR